MNESHTLESVAPSQLIRQLNGLLSRFATIEKNALTASSQITVAGLALSTTISEADSFSVFSVYEESHLETADLSPEMPLSYEKGLYRVQYASQGRADLELEFLSSLRDGPFIRPLQDAYCPPGIKIQSGDTYVNDLSLEQPSLDEAVTLLSNKAAQAYAEFHQKVAAQNHNPDHFPKQTTD